MHYLGKQWNISTFYYVSNIILRVGTYSLILTTSYGLESEHVQMYKR